VYCKREYDEARSKSGVSLFFGISQWALKNDKILKEEKESRTLIKKLYAERIWGRKAVEKKERGGERGK